MAAPYNSKIKHSYSHKIMCVDRKGVARVFPSSKAAFEAKRPDEKVFIEGVVDGTPCGYLAEVLAP